MSWPVNKDLSFQQSVESAFEEVVQQELSLVTRCSMLLSAAVVLGSPPRREDVGR